MLSEYLNSEISASWDMDSNANSRYIFASLKFTPYAKHCSEYRYFSETPRKANGKVLTIDKQLSATQLDEAGRSFR